MFSARCSLSIAAPFAVLEKPRNMWFGASHFARRIHTHEHLSTLHDELNKCKRIGSILGQCSQLGIKYGHNTKFFPVIGKMNTGKSTMCNSITQTFNPNEVDVKICETRNTATTDTNYRLFV